MEDFSFDPRVEAPEELEHYDFGPSMTRQEFAADCDINRIMAQYEKGMPLPAPVGDPMYVDWTEMPSDLMGFMALMDNAKEAFMTLPALVRRDMDNDPVKFVAFASDPANLAKMREYGLAPPEVASSVGAPAELESAPPAPVPTPKA